MKAMHTRLQAITTKYISATDHRGERIKATANAGSITLGWDYQMSNEENHAFAAWKLCEKYGWESQLISGALPNDAGFVFIQMDRETIQDWNN